MCSQSDPSLCPLWLSSYREKDAIKHLLNDRVCWKLEQSQNHLDALGALP